MSAQRLCLPGGALGPGCSPKPSRRACMNDGRVQGPGARADPSRAGVPVSVTHPGNKLQPLPTLKEGPAGFALWDL